MTIDHRNRMGKAFTLIRVFDAPREMVWKVWTDLQQVAHWWGPVGFSTPKKTIDINLRIGGRFNLCMVQNDTGTEYWVRHTQKTCKEMR